MMGTNYMEYHPTTWVVLKVAPNNGKVWYRVLGSWYGGYLDSDTWRMNSGITEAEVVDYGYAFHGVSGSVYYGKKNKYGMSSGYTTSVLLNYQDKYKHAGSTLELMPEDTDWLSLNYGLKKKE